jgi:hypothetical protein
MQLILFTEGKKEMKRRRRISNHSLALKHFQVFVLNNLIDGTFSSVGQGASEQGKESGDCCLWRRQKRVVENLGQFQIHCFFTAGSGTSFWAEQWTLALTQ